MDLQLQAAWHNYLKLMHAYRIREFSQLTNLKGYHQLAEDPQYPGNRNSEILVVVNEFRILA